MRPKVQHVVDVVLAISAATIAVVVVLNYLEVRRTASPSDNSYEVGDRIPDLAGVNYSDADRTLILFLRSTCGFCTKSMPFYRRLSAERRETGSVQIVAVGIEDDAAFGSYLREHSLNVDRVTTVNPGVLRLNATPTLMLVDRSQQLAGIWIGQLPSEREREVMSATGAYW